METAKFIHIGSQEAYDYIVQHCVDEGLAYPDDLGNWVYDDDEYTWREIGAYYGEKAKEIDFCRFIGWFPKAE